MGAYFDIYAVKDGESDAYVTRMSNNGPGGYARSTICILSGDQYPTRTHVKIVGRKGELQIHGVHFRTNVGDINPPCMLHADCVFSGVGNTSVSTERIKDNITPLDSDLLLDFCVALSPSMYTRTDLEPLPRLGLIAERVQEQITAHSLPTNIIGTRFEAIEKGGEIEELLGLDYARLSVALLGAVKELTNRITQLESQVQ